MGWTSYHAEYYKANGDIDRKIECDKIWTQNEGNGYPRLKVLKSSMVGSVYYAAVECTKRGEEREVFAVVMLTSVHKNEYFNFAYKDMDETCGPYECKCPKGILDLLTPTNNEYALNWRERCYEYIEQKKKQVNKNNLPVGTVIEYKRCDGESIRLQKMAPNYQFKRCWWYRLGKYVYVPARRIPDNFTIVSIPK